MTVTSPQIVSALRKKIPSGGKWEGTHTLLASELGLEIHPRGLSVKLKKLNHTLEIEGFSFLTKHIARSRLVTIKRGFALKRSCKSNQRLCERCGHLFQSGSKILQEVHAFWERDLFCKDIPSDIKNIKGFCFRCAIEINEHVIKISEIEGIREEINQLGELIDEKRT